jgi:predicted Rossmann fold nucleotide-binding protein DprA/Smf involved in DNA uptake
MSKHAAFALALLRIDGVGRVTAQRLTAHFPTYDALQATPREQVLLRIKGAPRAADLVGRLFDEDQMRPLLEEASGALDALESQRIAVLTPHDEGWPSGLDALDLADRPAVLYGYGDVDLLTRPSVALFARPPLPGPAFEIAQDLVRTLLRHDLVVVAGAEHGFDVVVHKLCAGAGVPSILVANVGMARIPKPIRPVASAAARAGGLLLSPFPVTHGPFAHDDAERALVMAALARASAFFAPPPDSHEMRALTWAIEHERPAFGVAGERPLPERVHSLDRPIDLDWVVAAASPEGDLGS